MTEPVTLINAFEVSADQAEHFITAWEASSTAATSCVVTFEETGGPRPGPRPAPAAVSAAAMT
jgi:hypothetical protein